MRDEKRDELVDAIFGQIEGDMKRTIGGALEKALESIAEETTIAEALSEDDDGYLYFGGDGQERDPRLPAGVAVEVRDGTDDPWVYRKYGYFSDIGTYQYETTKGRFKQLRVKKSEIIDIGDRAVGRLVEAWHEGKEMALRGFCIDYLTGEDGWAPYYVALQNGEFVLLSHVRLINNAEVGE